MVYLDRIDPVPEKLELGSDLVEVASEDPSFPYCNPQRRTRFHVQEAG